MALKGLEKRTCHRFGIPGSTVSFRKEKLFSKQENYEDDYCPLLDISRGGLRLLCQRSLKINIKLILKISIPDESTVLRLRGKVTWAVLNPGKSYKYQIGIQFNPYGERAKQNPPAILMKIIALEEKLTKNQ